MRHHVQLIFIFLVETKFHHVGQGGLITPDLSSCALALRIVLINTDEGNKLLAELPACSSCLKFTLSIAAREVLMKLGANSEAFWELRTLVGSAYLKFLDQLLEKMKLDQMADELGFDMRLDVVLARTEQLIRLESNAVIENKTIAHNLQRKLKTQKERLESKELHMSLLRQKIAQLEDERQARTALVVERDSANLTIRNLQKKVERMQKELSTCRDLNTELKAKLADTNELKARYVIIKSSGEGQQTGET
ncbi:Coiled-coil domain-containing protein 170 [Plecturocebus cupreus]